VANLVAPITAKQQHTAKTHSLSIQRAVLVVKTEISKMMGIPGPSLKLVKKTILVQLTGA